MGLIFERILQTGYSSDESVSSLFFYIPKQYLSSPFELDVWTSISGKIIQVSSPLVIEKRDKEILDELKDEKLEFVLNKILLGSSDQLFLSDTSWQHIREYGVLPHSFIFKIKLTEMIKKGDVINIFPKRDVIVI